MTWLLLLVALALPLPAMLLELHRPDVTATDEAEAIATAIQTRHRQLGPAGAAVQQPEKWVPFRNGRLRWDAMPGVLWVHLAAFRVLEPNAELEEYVLAARLTAVAAALVTIGAVFWAGASLGGRRTAFFAALVCAASPLLIKQAREAGPAIYYSAWWMLSLAAALWALRPLRPPPSIFRQALGWSLCGLSLAMAMYTVGPVALGGVVVPIALAAVMFPNRLSHVMGLVAAALIGVLLVLPWALHAHQEDPGAWSVALTRWVPSHWRDPALLASLASRRSLLVLLALLPWTLWFLGAVVQPFSTSSAGVRRRLFAGWSWFLMALAMLLAAPRSAQAVALATLIPAGALLVGQLFNQYVELAAEGRFARFWRLLRWPHLLVLAVASVLVALALAAPPALAARGWLHTGYFRDMGWPYGATAGAALLALALLSIRWVVRDFPAKAFLVWGAWGVVLNLVLVLPWAQAPAAVNPWRSDAATLAALAESEPVFWLVAPGGEAPDPALVFYADRPLTPIDAQQLALASAESASFFVLGPPDHPLPDHLRPIARLYGANRLLYRHAPQNQASSPDTRPRALGPTATGE